MTTKGKPPSEAKPARKRKSAPAKKTKRARKPRRIDEASAIANPAAAGPAGPRLEGHVGAQYLLPLLSGSEARGLPGVVVTRVAFQRAGLGHPMDDVIVTGHDGQGAPATLELQAKRTIAFTASDSIFADIVALACRAAVKPEFETTRYELAVAIARTSTKIEQHIQDVLVWARAYQNPEDFFRRLSQTGAAHQGMRDFVEAFRGHMRTAGAVHQDAAVCRLLRHFQVLAFDFEQPGSMCALYARDRCARLLTPQEAGRAGQLWDSLQQIALEVDAAGGNLDARALRERITGERGYRLAGDRRLLQARERLADMAQNTLATIGTGVHGVRLERINCIAEAQSALDKGGYLEIRGAGGVGKSGVLKDLALRLAVESRVIVVAPHRVPRGGWPALQLQLGCEATARELLTDLAGDGGGTLFIDGIDRFDDPGERETVADLIRTAASVPEFRVVATARLDFDVDAREWLPKHELEQLGEAPPLQINELSDDEVTQLREADPALAALLRPGHPAEKLARNLYRLDRLARVARSGSATPHSEAQMAWQWWKAGDAAAEAGRRDRRQLLRSLAIHSVASSAPLDVSSTPGPAVDALIGSGSLRELTAVHVEFAHDVLRDWAIGCLLYEESEHLDLLPLGLPAPMRLVRGLEMAARLHAENGSDATAWRTLLDLVSAPSAHGSWRRSVLLALARSERARELLDRCLPELAAADASLLSELVRAAIVVDSQPAATLWQAFGVDLNKLPHDFIAPSGPAWLNLIGWSLQGRDRLPHGAVPQFVDLYGRWCNAFMGQDPLSPSLVERLYVWLGEVEARNHPRAAAFPEWHAARNAPGLSMTTVQESDLRTAFLGWCRLCPELAENYLREVASHPRRHVVFRELLRFTGTAAQAAPAALADLFLDALPEGDEDDERGHRLHDLFSHWDNDYFPASPARKPFLDLLWANAEQGLRLVRGVLAHAVRRRSGGRDPGDNRITIPFPDAPRSFPWLQSYTWARDQNSHVVASALMALEAWAHLRIERGDPVQAVVTDVLGPEGSPVAVLLVAVDVMLSHWPESRGCLWPFAASAELLALDRQRYSFDFAYSHDTVAWVHPEPFGLATLDSLRRRPSRRTALDAVLHEYGFHGPPEARSAMQQALRDEAARIGPPDEKSRAMADPKFAAMSALNRLDPANYREASDADGRTVVEYIVPAAEGQRLAEMQAKVAQGTAEVTLRGQLAQALDQPTCSVELLEHGMTWAMRDKSLPSEADADDKEWAERTRFIVASLLLRDGSPELKAAHRPWAREQLLAAANVEPDRGVPAKRLPYNPAAIAAVGLLASLRDGEPPEDLQLLLRLAARSDTGIASVLRAEVDAERPVRAELIRSLVRLGLVSAIYALAQRDDDDFRGTTEDYRARHEARERARKETEDRLRRAAVELEFAWLTRAKPEPAWPPLPEPRPPKARRRIRLGGPEVQPQRPRLPVRDFGLDSRAAAASLSLCADLWGPTQSDLLGSLLRHCWPWTARANGVGGGPDEEPDEQPYEWNDAYFGALVAAAVPAGGEGIAELLLGPIQQLPDERFFDAVEAALYGLDVLWLGRGGVASDVVIAVRTALAKRLVATRAWSRLVAEPSSGIEMHLGGAVAAVFLGRHDIGRGPRCYVLPAGAARAFVLLPMLTELAEQAAASTFVAVAFLGLLDVEPHASRLEFLARVVAAWWRSHGPSSEFWVDHGVGARACAWIDKAVLQGAGGAELLAGTPLATMMDTLVRCGIPATAGLSERIAAKHAHGAGS